MHKKAIWIIILCFFVVTICTTKIELDRVKVENYFSKDIPVDNIAVGDKSFILFDILSNYEQAEGNVTVRIVEIVSTGEKYIRAEQNYIGVNGSSKIEFIKQFQNSKMLFEVFDKPVKIKNVYINLKKLIYKDKIYYLNQEYLFLPSRIEKVFKNVIMWRDEYKYKPNIESKLPLVFDQGFKFLNFKLIQESGEQKLILTIQKEKFLENDYFIWLFAKAEDVSNKTKEEQAVGGFSFEVRKISEDNINGLNTIKYDLKGLQGDYQLYAGVYSINDLGEINFLKPLNEKNGKIMIGWFNTLD